MTSSKEILMAELRIMKEKEQEMVELYSQMLSEIDDNILKAKIEPILKDEKKHVGIVKILMDLMEKQPSGKG